MQYAMLIYSAESDEPAQDTKEFDDYMGAYFKFSEEVQGNGMFQNGAALQPIATATTVTVRDGKTSTTDGPFAETKEQLGGLYVLECKDLDDAIEWASKIPTAKHGRIEIRPIMHFDT